MSARDDLFDHIESLNSTIRGEFCVGCDCGPADRQEANKLIDAFAHELAERIRSFVGPREYDGEAEHITRYVAGWHDAADYVDPEALS